VRSVKSSQTTSGCLETDGELAEIDHLPRRNQSFSRLSVSGLWNTSQGRSRRTEILHARLHFVVTLRQPVWDNTWSAVSDSRVAWNKAIQPMYSSVRNVTRPRSFFCLPSGSGWTKKRSRSSHNARAPLAAECVAVTHTDQCDQHIQECDVAVSLLCQRFDLLRRSGAKRKMRPCRCQLRQQRDDVVFFCRP